MPKSRRLGRYSLAVLCVATCLRGEALAQCPVFSFTETARISAPGTVGEFIAAGDVNGDGSPDLLMKRSPYHIQIGLGDGSGLFSLLPALVDTGDASSAAVGDLNGDGMLDLTVGSTNSVRVYQGLGDGRFALRRLSNLRGNVAGGPLYHATAVLLDDFNSDRRLDVAFPIFPLARARVELSDATGFGVPAYLDLSGDLPPNARPYHIISADFGRDGLPDLAIADHHGGTVELFQRHPAHPSGFNRLLPVNVGAGPFSLVKGDFNEDKYIDLAVRDADGRIVLLKGGVADRFGRLTFERWKDFTPSIFPNYLAVADFNADRRDDLLITGLTGDIELFRGEGNGDFVPEMRIHLPGSPTAIAIADFDRNGLPDFAVVEKTRGHVAVFVNRCPTPAADLQVAGIESTQTIQDLGNTAPLVAGKRTFVRVHTASNVQARGLAARLSGADQMGTPLGPSLNPLNLGGRLDLPSNPDREALGDSFYFEIPIQWTELNGVTLTAEVNTTRVIAETDYTNNIQTAGPLQFTRSKPLKVRLVRYEHPLVALSDDEWEDAYAEVIRDLLNELPISAIEATRSVFVDAGEIGTVPRAVELAHFKQWHSHQPHEPGIFHYGLGKFHGGIGGDLEGGLGHSGSTVWLGLGDTISAVHEFGHMLNLSHVAHLPEDAARCRSMPEFTDPAYPYPGGRIGGPAIDPTKFVGLDPADQRPVSADVPRIVPSASFDTMTYCSPRWFSDWSLRRIIDYIHQNTSIKQRSIDADPQQGLDGGYQEGDWLALYGAIDASRQQLVSLTVSREPRVGTPSPPRPGPYRLRLLDAADILLAEHEFSSTRVADAGEAELIAVTVPFVAGTRTILIYSDRLSRPLASLGVSKSAPVVRQLSVSHRTTTGGSGRMSIAWSAADADGDALTYTVLYSADNKQTWQALAMRLKDPRHMLDSRSLKGSAADAAFFRVIAHDGVLTGQADSAAITIANKPPHIVVLAPQHGASYAPGQSITFEAVADDLEDGAAGNQALAWSSNRDGWLGKGRLVQLASLSTGEHIVTVTITDSGGNQTVRRLPVHVGPTVSSLWVSCAIGRRRDDFALGGYGAGGHPWAMRVADVKALIKQAKPVYVVDRFGHTAKIRVVRAGDTEYLRSERTRFRTDNLLMLPACR